MRSAIRILTRQRIGPRPQAPPLPGVGRSSEAELAERTADLQRLQAEFANYRKRVDRDRVAVGELAAGRVLADLLPVLDDIDRAGRTAI